MVLNIGYCSFVLVGPIRLAIFATNIY